MTIEPGDEISVCLLTYNHAHLLETTIASIQRQTISGYEIIVSDDCSTDDTWLILQRLSANDYRIRPIRTPSNLGMPGNANFAVSHSSRPYIALLHHDDLCRADLLEKWLGVMARNSDVGFVFNPYGAENSDFISKVAIPSEKLDGKWFLKRYLFPNWGCPVRGTAMIRRVAWNMCSGMNCEFGLLADIDLWMRLSMQAPVGYVDEPVLILRQQRPDEYPIEYCDLTWSRLRYLYHIHAINRIRCNRSFNLAKVLSWWMFRIRLSVESARWLTYAIVKRKDSFILSSKDSITPYDLFPLRLYRSILYRIYCFKRTWSTL
jgi:glycosyltransferase involved in cell wall biosynthesis